MLTVVCANYNLLGSYSDRQVAPSVLPNRESSLLLCRGAQFASRLPLCSGISILVLSPVTVPGLLPGSANIFSQTLVAFVLLSRLMLSWDFFISCLNLVVSIYFFFLF